MSLIVLLMKNEISIVRDYRIDTIKGLAIIGVVFAHMSFTSRFELATLILVDDMQKIFGWCVVAFFFSSGLLCKKNNCKDSKTIYSFIYKKFKRLIAPCFVFSITYKLILSVVYLSGKFTWKSPIPKSVFETIIFLFER